MSGSVLIFDTTVLCCWLQVPGKETAGPEGDLWDHARIQELIDQETTRGSTFVLPLATLIETGNHISQLNGDRHTPATELARLLLATANGESPWAAFTDQSPLWEADNLRKIATDWPTHAAQRLSLGDVTIKDIAEYYATANIKVTILTGDVGLQAYSPTTPVPIPRRRS